MQDIFVIICLALMLVFGAAAAMLRSMLKATMALAMVSALLACVMFLMGATWAGLFELSVCVGLVTVVFISAISLTTPTRKDPEKVAEHKHRFAALPFILIFLGVAMIALFVIAKFDVVSTAETLGEVVTFKEAFWNMRQADILGQIIIILAGALAVVILFKEGGKA